MITAVVVRTLGLVIVRGLLGLVGFGPAPEAKNVEIAVDREKRLPRDIEAPDSAGVVMHANELTVTAQTVRGLVDRQYRRSSDA